MADRNDLPSPGASNFGQRVRETLMTYLGRQGDPLDRGVTLRDLIEAGLIKVRDGMRLGLGSGIPPIEPVVDGGGGVGGTVDPYEPDLTPPPTPTGFAVLGAISHVFIEHDSPLYSQGHGHLRTRVYGKIVNTGDPLPTFSEAEELAQFTGTTYAHPSDPATTWRLWIKWETNDNVLSVTPAGGTNGLEAITGQDVSSLLEALSGSISEGQLATSLTDRIDLIDGPDTASGSVNARIKVVQDIASVKNRTYYSASPPEGSPGAPLVLGDLWFDTDAQNKLYRWTGSAWVAVDDARIASLVTDLSTEVTSRISGDLAETRKTEALYAASFAGTGNAYKVFVQESEPTGTQIGDIWSWVHPTTGAVTFKRFNGSTWVDSSSNKRPATYHGASSNAPTASLVIGDLYYDIEDKKVYVYNGATWSQKLTTMPEVAAFVYSESVARVDGDGALAQTLSTISATKTRSYWQPTAPTGTVAVPLVEGDLWFDTDDNNQVYRWSGSAWQSGRDGTIAIVDARVTNVETAKIGYCTIGGVASDHTNKTDCQAAGGTWWVGLPLATAVKQVAISDGETTAALEQRFTAQKTTNNGLLAQYTVKVDVAGHVSGFGLASTLNNATPFSEFGIRADRFWIAPPATSSSTAPTTGLYKGYVWRDTGVTPAVTRYYTGSGWTTTPQVLPFVVQATPTTINGQEVPAGVYINGAYIQGGTIDGASIKGGSITGSKLIDVSANKITGAALLETAYIESYNYVSGTSGWKINGNGNAEFSGVVVRGTIYASAGTIGGSNIGSTYIQSTNFVTGSAGWRLQSNGAAEFGAASIRGQLTASQIDSRGLSIKDASGNIILAAGSPLATSNISGLGTLATQNSVDYSSVTGTKPPANATANTIYRQASDPGAANGDIWVDTSVTPNVTKVRISGSWQTAANNVTAASQVGAVATDLSNAPAGILNSNITLATLGYTSLQGAGAPASGLGVQGDNYWDTTNAVLYYKTGASTWTRVSPNITSTNVTTYIANGAIGSAQVGTLTAGNIDTRGLLIRDNDNNILFGAGYALNWNNVGGNKPVQWRVKSEGNSAGTGSGVWNMDTGTQVAYHNRSYNLVRINRSTGALIAATSYDVYGNGANGQTLCNLLNSLTSAEIIVLYTADEPLKNRLLYDLPQALYRCGASPEVFGRGNFKNRAAYILIGSPGIGKGNGYEAYRGDKNDDVNSKLDVTFTIQNGTFMVSGLKANNAIPSSDFVQYLTYDFNNETHDWGVANTTATLYPYYVNLTASNNSGMAAQTPIIAIVGQQYTVIRARIRRKAGAGWRGYCYYSTAFHGMSESYKKVIPDPTVMDEWVIAEWNMAELTDGANDWTTNTITQIRLDLGVITGDSFDIDWISVGRIGPLKIDSTNIGTYIANLSVDTLQIAGNAVTFPAGAQRASDTADLTTSNQNVLSVSVNSKGAPLYVVAKVLTQWLEGAGIYLDLYINDTLEATESVGDVNSFWDNQASGKKAVMFHFYKDTTPSAAAFNVQIRARKTGTAQAYIKANSNLFAIATKK